MNLNHNCGARRLGIEALSEKILPCAAVTAVLSEAGPIGQAADQAGMPGGMTIIDRPGGDATSQIIYGPALWSGGDAAPLLPAANLIPRPGDGPATPHDSPPGPVWSGDDVVAVVTSATHLIDRPGGPPASAAEYPPVPFWTGDDVVEVITSDARLIDRPGGPPASAAELPPGPIWSGDDVVEVITSDVHLIDRPGGPPAEAVDDLPERMWTGSDVAAIEPAEADTHFSAEGLRQRLSAFYDDFRSEVPAWAAIDKSKPISLMFVTEVEGRRALVYAYPNEPALVRVEGEETSRLFVPEAQHLEDLVLTTLLDEPWQPAALLTGLR